jgi:hypothetical protein
MAVTLERNTRALKTLVIVLGVLILAGTGVVIVTIANRLTATAPADTTASLAESAPAERMQAAASGFGTIDVPLPARCRVATAMPSGDRLVLQLAGNAEDCRQILVLDLASGRLLGRLNLVSPAQPEDTAPATDIDITE